MHKNVYDIEISRFRDSVISRYYDFEITRLGDFEIARLQCSLHSLSASIVFSGLVKQKRLKAALV